jgi:hypothetical protein
MNSVRFIWATGFKKSPKNIKNREQFPRPETSSGKKEKSMKQIYIILLMLATTFLAIPGYSKELYKPLSFFLTLDGGYNHGLGVTFRISLLQLAKRVPLGLELGGGYSHQFDPGDAEAARKIFINDTTGGTIEKYGYNLLVFLNLKYRVFTKDTFELFVNVGGRHNWYAAHFAFIGNNEVFDVKSDQWGIGVMAETRFAVSRKVFISLTAGIDYYFPAKIYGHGTYYYTPDGTDQNARNSYTYADADAAVNQPWLDFKAVAGVSYRL